MPTPQKPTQHPGISSQRTARASLINAQGAPSPGRAAGLCGAAAPRAWRCILHHTLPGAWGRGTYCIPEQRASWGCECQNAGAILHPHSPSHPHQGDPSASPARAAEQMGEGAGRGPGSCIGQKTGLGPANSWELGTEARKVLWVLDAGSKHKEPAQQRWQLLGLSAVEGRPRCRAGEGRDATGSVGQGHGPELAAEAVLCWPWL